MKKMALAMVSVMFVLCCMASEGYAHIYFDDGGVHTLDYANNEVHFTSYGYAYVYDNFWNEPTTLNIVLGGIVGIVSVWDNSIVNVFDGEISSSLYAEDDSEITISGGYVRSLVAYNYSSISVSGGTIDTYLSAYDDSEIAMSGGYVNNRISAYENSSVYISGGQIGGPLEIGSSATVIVDGLDFMLDGQSVTGTIVNPLATVNTGHLTGTYINGDPVDFDVQMQPGASVTFIPEPASLLLLAAGAFIFRTR